MRLFVGYTEESVEIGIGVIRVDIGYIPSVSQSSSFWWSDSLNEIDLAVKMTHLPMILAVLKGGLVPIAPLLV
jgi:hypothetical protein